MAKLKDSVAAGKSVVSVVSPWESGWVCAYVYNILMSYVAHILLYEYILVEFGHLFVHFALKMPSE